MKKKLLAFITAAMSVVFAFSLAACNGGDVAFENLGAGESIALKAKNGNITGSVSGSIDDFSIECTIKKGESNLPTDKKEGEKLLSADCNNGDIEINFAG